MGHKRGSPNEMGITIARYCGLGSRVRGVIWTADAELMAHHRKEWPKLWEALDDLIAFVDEQLPPFGRPEAGSGVRAIASDDRHP